MSTLTQPQTQAQTQAQAQAQAQPRPGTAVPARLLSVPLAATFVAEFTSLTSFFLLLSVMPMLAAAAGASSSGAGLITGSLLLGTVAAEAAAAAAIRWLGYRIVLAGGAVLLGGPALAMLVPEPRPAMVIVSLVRGFGFGLCGVATGALTAKLLPAGRRGEGLGLLGIISGIPAIVALPTGIWLAGHHLAAAAAAMAATAGLLPLAVIRWLPGGRQDAGRPRGAPHRPRHKDAGRPELRAEAEHLPAAAADLCRRHHRGRRARLVPAARERDPQQPLFRRPARAGDHRHAQPLAGG
jgi:MFS family permease